MEPPDYEQTYRRLENWGRCLRSGAGELHGRCGSIEGRYLREKLDEEKKAAERNKLLNVLDHLDAEVVEAAVTRIHGRRLRKLLSLYFVSAYKPETICRKLKIAWDVFDACVRRAVYEVYQSLQDGPLINPLVALDPLARYYSRETNEPTGAP